LRQTASMDPSNVVVLDKGAQVTVLGNAGNWLRVQHGDRSGFVYIDLAHPQPAGEAAWMTTVTMQELYIREVATCAT
jgi:hypothetical protein